MIMLQNYIENLSTDRFGKYFWVVFISILAILAGGFIYIFIRPVEADFVGKLVASRAGEWIPDLRSKTLIAGQFLPAWFVYSLPNGLWAFAYALVISIIWLGSKATIKYLWFASIPVLVFGFELLQLYGVQEGTFSIADLVWGAIGILAGYFWATQLIKH